MWWPIRYQWLVPFAIILLIAVAVTSISSAWLAAKRNTTTTLEQLNRVIDTLVHSRFPFSQNVLEQMRRTFGGGVFRVRCRRGIAGHDIAQRAGHSPTFVAVQAARAD